MLYNKLYPSDKNIYGHAAWTVLHNRAARLPEIPNRTEKIKFRHFLHDIIHYFPCDDCAKHGQEYVRNNPPRMRTKHELQNYLCEFHNDINQKLGKPVVDCKTLEQPEKQENGKEKECDTCSTIPLNIPADQGSNRQTESNTDHYTDEHKNPEIEQHSNKLKSSLGQYKDVTLKVFDQLMKNEGIETSPTIIFGSCPGKHDTSCTHFAVDTTTGQPLSEIAPVVYLDPNSFSPRTIAHEAQHIIAAHKGKERHWHQAVNEQQVDDIARDIIAKEFPLDSGNTHNSVKTQVVYDSNQQRTVVNSDISNIGRDGSNNSSSVTPTLEQRISNRLSSWQSTLPTFSKTLKHTSEYQPTTTKNAAPTVGVGFTPTFPHIMPSISFPGAAVDELHERQQDPPEMGGGSQITEGVLALGDPIFRPVGDVLGVSAADVNLAHTPAILGNIVVTTAESNLNSFGSTMVSILASTLSLAIGTLAKDQLGMGDRKFILQLGADMLWNTITYIGNPVKRNDVINNARRFGNAVAHMDYPLFVSSVAQVDVMDRGDFGQTGGKGHGHGGPHTHLPDSLLPKPPGSEMSRADVMRSRPLSPHQPERNFDNPFSTNLMGSNISSASNRPGAPLGGRTIEVDGPIGGGRAGELVADDLEGEVTMDEDFRPQPEYTRRNANYGGRGDVPISM